MTKVEYNGDNCMRCQCAACPVEAMSQCTLSKRHKWSKMRADMIRTKNRQENMNMGMDGGSSMGMEQMEMLSPQEMIGLYCSNKIGKSTCGDLNTNNECICPSCEVWNMANLKSYKYCTKGDADEIG